MNFSVWEWVEKKGEYTIVRVCVLFLFKAPTNLILQHVNNGHLFLSFSTYNKGV